MYTAIQLPFPVQQSLLHKSSMRYTYLPIFVFILNKVHLIQKRIFVLWGLASFISVIVSSLDYLVSNGRFSFFLMAEQCAMEQMCHSFFIHSSFNGNLHCFPVYSIVDCAAINIGVQVTFSNEHFILFGNTPTSGITESYRSIFSCLNTLHSDCHSGWNSHQQQDKVLFFQNPYKQLLLEEFSM